jgi:PAS domain S-box-containing protein
MKKKIALAFALVIVTCVILLTLFAYLRSREALSTAILRESRAALATTALLVEQVLDGVRKDVLVLNGTAPMRGILRARRAGGYDAEAKSTYEMWVERFQQLMASLLSNKPDYWQARYIDERGQERVRVDNLDGTIRIVPTGALQNKTEYPYFAETMKLPPGGLYVSRLDLNRERGRIETPHRPTLRVATPVFDVLNQRKGVIVINLHAAGLMNRILAQLRDLSGQAYLVDQDGFFLAHPDPAKTFGFDLGHDYRLQHSHPRLAERLRDTETFVEIVRAAEVPGSESHAHGFRKIAYDPLNPRNYWAIVFDVPSSVALAPVTRLRDLLLGLGLAIALLGSYAGFVWAGRMSRPLKELTATANHIAGRHYDRRVELTGKRDEVRELSISFNSMVDALLASERRLANILDTAGDAVVSIDEDQRVVAYNRTAEQIFGYAPADVLGQPLELLLPADVAAVHHEHVRAFGREPGLTRVMGSGREIAGRRAEGSTFPAEASISKVIEGGRTVYTAILRDVTERKRAEQEREKLVASLKSAVTEAIRNRAQLEAVFESMEDGIAVFNMQGDLVMLNEAQARINGFASTEEMRRNLAFYAEVYELTGPEGQAVPVDQWPVSRSLRGESVSNRVLRGRRKDTGQEWFFSFSGAPVHDQEGKQILAVIITRDITEYRKAEDEIRTLNVQLETRVQERTAELAAANKELEAFSYSVSHDLRAPLRSIDGFSQALLEDYAPRLDPTGQDYLRRVRAATLRMAELIDDLLQLSRVTRAEMRRETVDLSTQAESVVAELRHAEPQRRIEVEIPPGLQAEGDPSLLRIVLQNLLSNAWKFTVRQPVAHIALGAQDNGSEQVFHVRDNGAGFDMAYAHKLFGAFQRLHSPAEFPGTGIGLATVQRIVHRHGGRVWVEGAIGEGATFYFALPARRDA